MSFNTPEDPRSDQLTGPADTRQFDAVEVSTGNGSAYLSIELILYVLVSLAIFITAAVIDEADNDQGFGASDAWFCVTLLTVGFFISRGLGKIAGRSGDRVL